jgi:tRNA(fMet)-specific endonuclease VapC
MSDPGPLWLLDTNIISGLMREPQGAIAYQLKQRLLHVDGAKIATSVIADCELRFGLVKKSSPRLLNAYRVTIAAIEVLDFDSGAVQRYADLRNYLENQGTPIGPNDMLIAAHAISLGCILVTDNEEEFCRIPGLRVENWLKSSPI